jgi:hypothetical protein
MESLAVELNMPALLTVSKTLTVDQLRAMKYDELKKLCSISPENFIALKQALK